MSKLHSISGRLAALTCLLGALGTAAVAGEPLTGGARAAGAETRDATRRVHELVEQAAGDRAALSTLPERLAALGPDAIPELYRLGIGEASETGPSLSFAAAEQASRAAVSALKRLPAQQVLGHLGLRLEQEPRPENALVLLRIAGELESPACVPFVLDVLTRMPGPQVQAGPLNRAGREALGRLFRAAPRSLLGLKGSSFDETVFGLVLEAVDESNPAEAIPFLAANLGKKKPRELDVLRVLGRLAARYPWRSSIDVASLVRPYLLRGQPQARLLAATILGELHDLEAVELLVQVLGDADERVAVAARRSLGLMTGVDRGDGPGPWRTYLKEEEARWSGQEAARQTLNTGEGTRQLAAARTLATFRLRRVEVGRAIVASLDGEAAYVSRALDLLGDLGWRGCVADVIPFLDARDPDVRRAAYDCLRDLTGEKLPARSDDWRDWARD